MSDTFAGRTLSVVVCGAGPATHVGQLITLAQDHGWTVAVTATPAGLGFLDLDDIEARTRRPVRSQYRPSAPAQQRALPDAEAIIVAPATYNTINKLALGISDTYALGTLAEAIGRGTPVTVVPFVNTALATRTPFQRAMAALRHEGVHILLGPDDRWEPHPPGTGNQRIPLFPWSAALHAAEAAVARKNPHN